jgi:MFS family permease
LAIPFFGRMIDAVGSRKVIIPSVIIFALGLLSFQLFEASLLQFYIIFALIGIVAGGTSTLAYFKVVTKSFRKRRGLALGFANTGSGMGALLIPYISFFLIAEFGWRSAYSVIGLGVMFITIPLVWFGLNESYVEPVAVDDEEDHEKLNGPGLTVRETIRGPEFWIIGIAFFLGATALLGYLINMVPLLTDRGLSVQVAAAAASTFGLAQLAGRFATGFLLDRFFAPYIIVGLWCIAALVFVLLWSGMSGSSLIICTALLGFAWGGEGDILAYLVGRYFGIRHFGGIYGLLLSLHMFGGVIGPYLLGLTHDMLGSYSLMLALMAIAIFVASILILRLGPYPEVSAGKAEI